MTSLFFSIGTFLQLCGIASVGLCLFSGLLQGDYGKIELAQFLGGSVIFYMGHFLKLKSTD